jgi:hypothetical protein
MREFCLTEEVIQRFVDGELSQEQSETAAAHLAACEPCASLLDEVEQENALMAEAFAPELSLPVPSAQLRASIDRAIAGLEPHRSVMSEPATRGLRAWFGSLFGSFSFTPQQALGFASIAVVIALVAIFAVIQLRQSRQNQPEVAIRQIPSTPDSNRVEPPPPTPQVVNASATPETTQGTPDVNRPNADRRRFEQAGNNFRKSEQPKKVQPANQPTTTPLLLPGEQGYLEAIASLTTAIEVSKNDVLKPAVRADYERNLAVVDQAIASTRQQAKRNPKDRDAAEFMYMAYQNKIDMLNAVADQTRIAAR